MNFRDCISDTFNESDSAAIDQFLEQAEKVFSGDFETKQVVVHDDAGWIATRLGVPSESLKKVKACEGAEPGDYYQIEFDGHALYVHSERKAAYVSSFTEAEKDDILGSLIQVYGIHPLSTIELNRVLPNSTELDRVLPNSNDAHQSPSNSTELPWIHVAGMNFEDGSEASARPIDLEQLKEAHLSMEWVRSMWLNNPDRLGHVELIKVEKGQRLFVKGSTPPGWCDIFGDKLESVPSDIALPVAGEGVKDMKDGTWVAEKRGFLSLSEGALNISSPILIHPEAQWADYLVSRGSLPLDEDGFREDLQWAGVVFGEIKGVYCRLNDLAKSTSDLVAVRVAEALKPKDGSDSCLDMHVEPLNSPGDVQDDGSIDYRSSQRIQLVHPGQIVAKKITAIDGHDGKNVLGVVQSHRKGKDQNLQVGRNIDVVEDDDGVSYRARIKGILKYEDDFIDIVDMLHIPGDVNYNTGNIEFSGEVFVEGSVHNGFTIRAGGMVTVCDSVENGAQILCKGDLRVGKGILGEKTKIVAGGSISARFIQEATVMGGENLDLTDHIYHAKIRCEGQVTVRRETRSNRSGSIIGGYTWGLKGVSLHFAGSPGEVATMVGTGVDDMKQQAFGKAKKEVDELHQQVMFLVKRLGLSKLSPDAMKALVDHKPALAPAVKRLMELMKLFRSKKALYQQSVEQLEKELQSSEIQVSNRCFPGVVLHQGRHSMSIKKANFARRYFLKDNVFIAK